MAAEGAVATVGPWSLPPFAFPRLTRYKPDVCRNLRKTPQAAPLEAGGMVLGH